MDHRASFQVPAEAYDRHVGRYSPALAKHLCDHAALRAGDRALDVGCGPGGLTAELAERLGPAHVAAVEPSASFAEACAARLPGVDVRVASAESLPFADGDFDAVLSQLVVNFLPDGPAGLAEMRRVTRQGGSVSAAVWDYSGEMTLLRVFWEAAAAVDPATRAADESHALYITPASLRDLWASARLADVRVEPAVVPAKYDGFDDLWAPFQAGVGPAGALVNSMPPDLQVAVADEMRQRLGVGSEPFRLTARAWMVTGRTE
ncbi:class I SAM-dependent methyltransferase [Nocardioides bigeumensis]|jgi:ubiquinone/menaquinone biosynthesis C-methylase UbiE|uniref:Class I SAM-dependent methyltransferase n=1 Tax=Nocardioides bigeumensis TaxID=433657 RepID=A0ABN2XVY1_9ACTN